MIHDEIKRLIAFYEENLTKHRDTIKDIANKDDSPTARMYTESSKRYSEGFIDALEMVVKHLKELEEK